MTLIKKIDNPDKIFDRENLWDSYLKVEGELALAQSQVGIIPKKAAKEISKNAKLNVVGLKNIEKSFKITKSLILSIVQELSKKCNKDSGGYVHWGGTTRNVIDTGRNLLIREAHRNILDNLSLSIKKLSVLSELYSETPMLGRTMGQNAVPISFGFKVSGWIESLMRLDKKFIDSEKSLFCLYFGGAVGAMHGFNGKGQALTNQLAKNLGFNNSLVPNRTSLETSIDYLLSLSFQGMIIGKIANEIYSLMSQSINEISEKQTKGQVGSSTMPHKINPVIILTVIEESALLRGKVSSSIEAGMPLHEGDLRYNKIIDNLIKDSTILSLNLFNNFNYLLDNLNINYEQMEDNLLSEKDYIASENLMYNLAKHIGRQDAHDTIHSVIQKSMSKNISVIESLAKDKTISNFFTTVQIDDIMNPLKYIGESKKISLNVKKISLKYIQKIKKRASSFDLLVRS